jgi:hypothetical protein
VAEQSDSDDDDDNGSCKSLGNSPQRPKQRQTENSPGLEGLERDDSIDKFPAADDADINDGDDRDSLQQEMPTEEEKNEMDEEPPVKVEKEDKRRRSRRNNKDVTETVMIIHEPQVDFYPGGNWYTKGVSSDDSISRLAKFILENVQKIDRLVVIMDVHQVSGSECDIHTVLIHTCLSEHQSSSKLVLGKYRWRPSSCWDSNNH